MKDFRRIFVYIGTPESYFTKVFLPKLHQIENAHLNFICVRQNEFTIFPSKASFFLRFTLKIKAIINSIKQLSSIQYWSFYCKQNKIQFELIRNINSKEVEPILEDSDFVLSAGIRSKLSPEILAAPKNGIVNFHYSLLPKFRGTNPVFWQKVNADTQYGYTFHIMNEIIDQGDIVLQNQVEVKSDTSVSLICDQLTVHASNQLFKLINKLPNAKVQNEKDASEYTNQDYVNYVKLHTDDNGSIWAEKTRFTKLFILNDRWLVHLENLGQTNLSIQLSPIGSFTKDGHQFRFKKINYLPAFFYYFALRSYFE